MTEYQEQYKHRDQDESLDIKKLLSKVIGRWYWFILSICVAYAVAWWINRYTVPKYSVSSMLIVNEEKKSTAELLVSVIDRYSPRKNIDNEIAILKSYSMASLALKKMDFGISYYITGRVREVEIYPNASFTVIPDSVSRMGYGIRVHLTFLPDHTCRYVVEGKIDQTVPIGQKFEDPLLSFTLKVPEDIEYKDLLDKKYSFTVNSFHSLVNQYRSKVSVTPNDKRGSVLILSLSGAVAKKEADYLNTLMDTYIQSGLDEKNQTSINTIVFIDEQLGIVTDSLNRVENLLQNFRLNNKSFDLSREGTIALERLTQLEAEKSATTMQLNYYKYLQKYVDTGTGLNQVVAPSVVGISDPLLNGLVSKLSGLSTDRMLLVHGGSEQNPMIKSIDVQIQTLRTSLQENVKQLVESANIAANDVDGRIKKVEQDIMKLPVTERQLMNIERDFNINNETYNFLLKKRADAAISKASNVADNKVLDYAMSENASQIAPKTSRNNLIAVVIGLLLPLLIIFVFDFFNYKITNVQDVKNATIVPIIGMISHNKNDSEVPVAENPASSLSESFRALRTNLHYILHDKSNKIINVTSTISGEGKTFVSINLATIIAHSGKKVLLIGLDLRKPKINKVFNLDNREGVSTYLIGDSAYENIIHPTNLNNLFVIPAGPIPPNPAELIDTPQMQQLLARASEDFDFIIVDTPPVAVVVDSLLLARWADVNIFVIRQNYSSKDTVLLAEDLYKRDGVSHLSIVLNDVEYSSAYALGKYYRYSYAYGYGYGYGNYYNDETPSKGLKGWWKRLFS